MQLLISLVAVVCTFALQPSSATTHAVALPVGVFMARIDPTPDVTQGVRALVWRPIKERRAPMTVGDLSRLVCPGVQGVAECFRDLGEPTGLPGDPVLSSTQLDALSRERLSAGVGGVAMEAKLPLVVMRGSLVSRGGEFIELAQLLASRGIVAAVVIPPLRSEPPAFTSTEVEAALAGLKRVVSVITNGSGVDGGRLGLVAWSFGGVPALLEATSNASVRVLVSLDSAMRYQYGVDLIRSSAAFEPGAYRGRLVSLVAGRTNAVPTSDVVLRVLSNAHVETRIVDGFRHGDFSDLYAALPSRLVLSADRDLRRRREEVLIQIARLLESSLE